MFQCVVILFNGVESLIPSSREKVSENHKFVLVEVESKNPGPNNFLDEVSL